MPNGWEAARWPNAKPAAGARTRMSRPSRSLRRGKWINAAADRRHLLDLDHLRTDRACAGKRAAFVAVVALERSATALPTPHRSGSDKQMFGSIEQAGDGGKATKERSGQASCVRWTKNDDPPGSQIDRPPPRPHPARSAFWRLSNELPRRK